MNYRAFGNTNLTVSEVGFGAWGIGGPAMAGDTPIGWGDVDDNTSREALKEAFRQGVTFYDTADFYGLGHSEKLIGEVFGNRDDVIIASKAGHRLKEDGTIFTDYSKKHVIEACNASLKRLKRDAIDLYQLHTAKVADLENGECLEALDQLQQEGKIRYRGLSLHTFEPEPEAEYMLQHGLGNGFQLVLNILNQQSLGILDKAKEQGMGIIVRMPLQFGVLTGKFTKDTRFGADDHRSYRLPPDVLARTLDALEHVWPLTEKYKCSKTELSMSFILSFEAVSTVIPGIKTPEQARQNTRGMVRLTEEDRDYITSLYEDTFKPVLVQK